MASTRIEIMSTIVPELKQWVTLYHNWIDEYHCTKSEIVSNTPP